MKEYKVLSYYMGTSYIDVWDEKEMQRDINALADNGWKVISCAMTTDEHGMYGTRTIIILEKDK